MSTLTLKGTTSGSSVLKAPVSGSNEVTFTMPASTGTLLSNVSTLDATKLTGALPAISGASLTSLTSGNLTGALPVISGANLTGLPGGSFTATADGSLTAGQATIIQTDGTVKAVTGSTVTTAIPKGTVATINGNANIDVVGIALDKANSGKGVITWRDGSSFKARVFTTSGTTITFGSATTMCTVGSGFRGDNQLVSYCGSDKFVIGYIKNGNSQNSSTNGCVRVCTVSGTTITTGAESTANGQYTNGFRFTCDQTIDDRIFAMYTDGDGNYRVKGIAATISGTSVSWGSEVTYNGNNGDTFWCHYDNGRAVIAYKDHGSSFYGYAVAGTISGNSMTWGSQVAYDSYSHASSGGSIQINPNNKDEFLVSWYDKSNSNYGTVRIGTISTNSISVGSKIVFESSSVSDIKLAWDKNTNDKFIVQYNDGADSVSTGQVKYKIGTISGASISFGSEISMVNSQSPASDSPHFNQHSSGAAQFLCVFGDTNNYDSAVWSQVGGATSTNLTADNFIGFSDGAYSDTATATVLVNGALSTNQSSLTPASKYYVQSDGTLSTTADSPSVYAGISTAATKLLIKG
jgi:hypothetical protein